MIFGSVSLVWVASGVLDYISRIVADIVKTVYVPASRRRTESCIYFGVA